MLDRRQNEIMHIFLMQAVNLERGLIVMGQTRGQLCPIIWCLVLEYEIWNLVLCKSIISYFEAATKVLWETKQPPVTETR